MKYALYYQGHERGIYSIATKVITVAYASFQARVSKV